MKRTSAVFLAFLMLLALAACAPRDTPDTPDVPDTPDTPDTPDVPDAPDTPEEPETPADTGVTVGLPQNVYALCAAGLQGKDGYELVIPMGDPAAGFKNGSLDAAILPVAEAAELYNSGAPVRIAAVTMSGGWELAAVGGIESVFELTDRTVYLPQDHPVEARIFEYIAEEYGYIIGDTLQVTYAPLADLADKDIALVPYRAAADAVPALDLREEWQNVTDDPVLPTACLAVRADLDAETLSGLMEDVKASIDAGTGNAAGAVALGLAGDEAAAESLLSHCDFLFVSGANQVREQLAAYYSLLYSLDPAFIGGHLPDDAFYI